MTFDTNRLLDLWNQPHEDADASADAFRQLYTDPVLVNGANVTAAQLVERAVTLYRALDEVRRDVLDVCEADGKVAVAFRLEGTHVGPLATSAGVLAPTGQRIAIRVIDILTFTDGRISSLVMVADELGALAPIGAAALTGR